MEPYALSMVAAWGTWCRRQGFEVRVENLGRHADYAARMKLFDALGIDYEADITEHEEAGRFLPVRNVRAAEHIRGVIADVSVLLHLQEED